MNPRWRCVFFYVPCYHLPGWQVAAHLMQLVLHQVALFLLFSYSLPRSVCHLMLGRASSMVASLLRSDPSHLPTAPSGNTFGVCRASREMVACHGVHALGCCPQAFWKSLKAVESSTAAAA